MPREQRVALKKTAVEKRELGDLTYKPSGTVALPTVTPEKSMGQSLAEGIGLAAKGLTVFAEGKSKERRKMEAIRQEGLGASDAGQFAAEKIKEANNLPLREVLPDGTTKNPRREFLMKSLTEYNESMKVNKEIHPSYYEKALRKASSIFEANAQAWDKKIIEDSLGQARNKLRNVLIMDLESGGSTHELLRKARDSQRFDTRAESTKFALTTIAATIEENIQNDKLGTYDAQADIDKYLKIKSEDGVVDFATDPKYKEIIDNLESDVKAHAAALLQKSKDYAKAKKDEITGQAMQLVLQDGADFDDLRQAEKLLETNAKLFSGKERGTTIKLLRELVQGGYAPVTDPNAFAEARVAANNGTLTLDGMTQYRGTLTADDAKVVVGEIIGYQNLTKTAEGAAYQQNVAKFDRGASQLLNKQDAIGRLLDPQNGPKRVQAFQDEFYDLIAAYKAGNNVMTVPRAELKKMRDEAQEEAFRLHPEVDLQKSVQEFQGEDKGTPETKDDSNLISDLFNALFGEDEDEEKQVKGPETKVPSRELIEAILNDPDASDADRTDALQWKEKLGY